MACIDGYHSFEEYYLRDANVAAIEHMIRRVVYKNTGEVIPRQVDSSINLIRQVMANYVHMYRGGLSFANQTWTSMECTLNNYVIDDLGPSTSLEVLAALIGEEKLKQPKIDRAILPIQVPDSFDASRDNIENTQGWLPHGPGGAAYYQST